MTDYNEKMIQETKEFHNIDTWQEMGYTGKGIRILECESYNSEHGKMVANRFRKLLPDSSVFLGFISTHARGGVVDSVSIDFGDKFIEGQEAIDFINSMDVISAALAGSARDELATLISTDRTMVTCSAGNENYKGVIGIFKNIGLSVGVVQEKDGEIVVERYSAKGDPEIDFVTFHNDMEGTSFEIIPVLLGLIKEKYPNLTNKNYYDVLKSISLDLGDEGFDTSYGWGLPVLPANGIVQLLEEGEDMFEDTKGHWAEKAIDKIAAEGLIEGFPDGTFRPNLALTRAEAAVIFERLANKEK